MNYPIKTYIADNATLDIPTREVARYLGYGGHSVSDADMALIEAGLRKVRTVLAGKACYTRCPIRVEGERLTLPYGEVTSRSLGKWMDGCVEAYFFAATIGAGFDRLLQRERLRSMTEAAVLQACGAAAVEAVCNALNAMIDTEAAAEGYDARRRYSPGYGDFALENQRGFFQLLTPARYIGLTLMDTLIMSPEKSVTAIIGISRRDRYTS